MQIDFSPAHLAKPKVYFNNKAVRIIERNGYWRAIVGLGLELKPGQHVLNTDSGTRKLNFTVIDKTYPTQNLIIENARLVNPTAADRQRIEKETQAMQSLLNRFSNEPQVSRLQLPLKGRKSSSFGVRRILNGQARNPHSGMDIAAAQGTPILAAAAGTVVLTEDLFYTGNTVVIDHGQGLTTLYAHLHSVDTELGAIITANQQIGTVGATGRATGPHLHWSVGLNGSWVNPELFLP